MSHVHVNYWLAYLLLYHNSSTKKWVYLIQLYNQTILKMSKLRLETMLKVYKLYLWFSLIHTHIRLANIPLANIPLRSCFHDDMDEENPQPYFINLTFFIYLWVFGPTYAPQLTS